MTFYIYNTALEGQSCEALYCPETNSVFLADCGDGLSSETEDNDTVIDYARTFFEDEEISGVDDIIEIIKRRGHILTEDDGYGSAAAAWIAAKPQTRWAIYEESSEVGYKIPFSEAAFFAFPDISNDVARKIVTTFDTIEEVREFFKEHHTTISGYKNRRSNRVYEVTMYTAYEQAYDGDTWCETGNCECARLDPEEEKYLRECD